MWVDSHSLAVSHWRVGKVVQDVVSKERGVLQAASVCTQAA